MPKTLKHQIEFPSGSQAPNIPIAMQTQAESVEAALSKVSEPPSIILRKNNQSASATSNAWTDILWEIEDHKTADMTHSTTSGQASVIVPTNGIYEVKAKIGVNVAGLTTGIIVMVNGVQLTYTIASASSAAGAYDKVATNHDLKLMAGDVVKIQGRVNSTGTTYDGNVSSFTIVRKVNLLSS